MTEKLKETTKYNLLTISSENRQSLENTIALNFDANIDETKWKDDFNVIITTEVLAEGINLHRSNIIVNYDVPWNSTRLMQRIGRVNRIGSRADKIYVYNFYPSDQGDAKINLVNNALRKLQAFHSAFGEDNKIFSLLEEKGEGALFGNKIQNEESEILIYLRELREFKKKEPKWFSEISKIPNKARCGRLTDGLTADITDYEGVQFSLDLDRCSISYLKSENHPGIYCLVTPELNTKELNFLQAVKILKASKDEKPAKLHDLHYIQTSAAFEFFKSDKTQSNIQTLTSKNLSPVEKTANKNLNWAKKFANTEQKKNTIARAIEIIKSGTYASAGLPKSINDYFNINLAITADPVKFIDGLFNDVFDRIDLSVNVEEQLKGYEILRSIINPKIVLTQSYYKNE